MNSSARLKDMLGKIAEEEQAAAESEGALKQIAKQLKDDFDCNDFKAARAKFKELEAEVEEMETMIGTGLTELENRHDWE